MNPEVKKKWVAALRTGHFRQGHDCLRSHDDSEVKTYCCLGVLCELHRQEVGGVWVWVDDAFPTYAYLGEDTALPARVMEWAGLGLSDPVVAVAPGTDVELLSDINDRGTSFEKIADLIEAQL